MKHVRMWTLAGVIVLTSIASLSWAHAPARGERPAFNLARTAARTGWFVRVCKTQTEASSVELQIGLGGSSGTHRPWRRWNSTEEAEFDIPEDLRNVREIWIRGIANPTDRNVSMCTLYQDHVTQKMTFDDAEEHETSQSDDDSCEC